jgi:hypothetical protein
MKQLIIAEDKFDFDAFLNATYEFIEQEFNEEDPSLFVLVMEEEDEYPGENAHHDVREELAQGMKALVPFAMPDGEECTHCAFGPNYRLELTPEEEDADEIWAADQPWYLDLSDLVGFLVAKRDGEYVIDMAKYIGGACMFPPPSLEIFENAGVFEEAMVAFITSFIKD